MYLFDIRKHKPEWDRFMDKFIYDNHARNDEMSLQEALTEVNAIDVPNDRFHVYFQTQEDASMFILKFG